MKALRRPLWMLTAFLIMVPLLLFGIVQWYLHNFEKLPVLGGYDNGNNGSSVQHTVSPFQFQNQDGQLFSSDEEKNKIMIVNFFFTSCTGICPNMMKHTREVQDYFLGDSTILFISFTVDPGRDSAGRLKKYAQQYALNTANWDLLTGNKKEIYKLARKSFYLVANDGDGGENDFIHSEQLVLVDKHRQIRGYYNGTDTKAMEQLKTDIKKLK